MIKELKLINFQAHKESVFNFHPGVNAIIGSSDVGKSSCIRAIELIATNKPSGDAYRSEWGGPTRVSMKLDNPDIKISRIRTKQLNQYEIESKSENKQVFKAMGQGVPKEIDEALNFHPINIQSQHEKAFLLSESSGEVARYLNKIIDLDIIDISQKSIASRVKQIRTDQKVVTQQRIEAESMWEDYEWVGEADVEIEALLEVENTVSTLEYDYDQLYHFTHEISRQKILLGEFGWLPDAEKDLPDLLDLCRDIEKEQDEINDLTYTVEEIEKNNDELEEIASILRSEKKIESLISIYGKISEEQKKFNDLYYLAKEVSDLEKQSYNLEDENKKLEQKLKEAMPDICPLCDQIIGE